MSSNLYRRRDERPRRVREPSPNSEEPVIEDYETDILYRPKNFGRLPVPGEENLVLSRAVGRKVQCAAGTAADKNRRGIEEDMAAMEMAIRRAERNRAMLNRALAMSMGGGQGGASGSGPPNARGGGVQGGANGSGPLSVRGGGLQGGASSSGPPSGRGGGMMGTKRKKGEVESDTSDDDDDDEEQQEEEEEENESDEEVGVVVELEEGHVQDSTEEESDTTSDEVSSDAGRTKGQYRGRSRDEEPSQEPE